MLLKGRRKIYTDVKEITSENIIEVLKKTYSVHRINAAEIQFLMDYEKGIQPLQREKIVRKEIDIRIEDNVANYVKEFKIGYFWSSPIMLVQRGNNEPHNTDSEIDDSGITALNEMLKNQESIGYKDQCMAEYVEDAGIGHRLVDIKTEFENEFDSSVNIYTLDSRFAFCVYYNGIGQKKMLGVTYVKVGNKNHFTCFTDKHRFEISGWEIQGEIAINPLGKIPIVEYERSFDRTGCFERQISDMDGLNIMVSDFANDVSQKTQEIWWSNDVKFPENEQGEEQKPKSGQWVQTFTSEGTNPKIQPLSSTFDAAPTLNAISYRWNRILQKCKVPTQQDSEGGGSTGTAMDMSAGWSAAEVDAMREQQIIEKGKREELELILRAISKVPTSHLPADHPIRALHSSDIEFHFMRKKNYDMSAKANTFATYVSHGIHGLHALRLIDAYPDVEQVWNDSRELIEAYQKSTFQKEESQEETNNTSGDPQNQIENSPIIDGMNTTENQVLV